MFALFSRLTDLISRLTNWIPLSGAGLLMLIGLVGLLFGIALPQHDRVLLAASIGGLFVVTVLATIVLMTAIVIGRAARKGSQVAASEPIDAVCELPLLTGFQLRHFRWVPCLSLAITWIEHPEAEIRLVPSAGGGVAEQVTAHRRGHTDQLTRRFEISDLFGLCRIRLDRRFDQPIRIEPLPAVAESVMQVQRNRDGDDLPESSGKPHGDLIEMRRYRPGDPLKLVLWKHYQRTGQLLVRQAENTVARSNKTVAAFIADRDDEATAGIAAAVLNHLGSRGESLWFQADGAEESTEASEIAIEQVIRSANRGPSPGQVMREVGKKLQAETCRECLVFVPSSPGTWIEEVVRARDHAGIRFEAIIGVDPVHVSPQRQFLPAWLFRSGADSQNTRFGNLQEVTRSLEEAGIPTRVMNRRTGETSLAS